MLINETKIWREREQLNEEKNENETNRPNYENDHVDLRTPFVRTYHPSVDSILWAASTVGYYKGHA